jgi:hypothetical protein
MDGKRCIDQAENRKSITLIAQYFLASGITSMRKACVKAVDTFRTRRVGSILASAARKAGAMPASFVLASGVLG